MKLFVIFIIQVLSFSLWSQDTLFFENFQDQTLGSFTTVDMDGLLLTSDFDGLTGAFDVTPVAGPNDFRAIGVSSFISTDGTADNWLISSEISIDVPATKLKWTGSSLSGENQSLEDYRVLVSTTGSATQNFTNVLLEITGESSQGMVRELDLTDYVGQSIFLAFNQIGTNNYALTLDDISVIAPTAEDAIALLSIVGDRYQDVADNALFIEVLNTGSRPITEFVATGSINGDSGDFNFDNLNILPQQTVLIPFGELYPFEADKYEIIAAISSVNGTSVAVPSLTKTVFMVENPPAKKFFLEESTSTACGWCPEGKVIKDLMAFKYSEDVINASVHRNDPMTNVVYDLGQQNLEGYLAEPSFGINRANFVAPSEVEKFFIDDFSTVAPVDIELKQAYDEVSRTLDLTIESVAHTTLEDSTHQYSVIILEDKVAGNSPDFAQANNYSSSALDVSLIGVDGIDWSTLADPVPSEDMVYDDVVRDIIGGFQGIEESITSVRAGEELSYTLDYTLSSAFDDDEIWIVVLVTDTETGEVVNAFEEKLLKTSTTETLFSVSSVSLFPNPASDYVDLRIRTDNTTEASLTISTYTGVELIKKGLELYNNQTSIRIMLENLENGLYFVIIRGDKEVFSQPLVVRR